MNLRPPRPERGALTGLRHSPMTEQFYQSLFLMAIGIAMLTGRNRLVRALNAVRFRSGPTGDTQIRRCRVRQVASPTEGRTGSIRPA